MGTAPSPSTTLGEGHYEIEIDVATIPDGYILATPARVAVAASSTGPAQTVSFELKIKPQAVKPVREMLKQEIHVNTPAAPATKRYLAACGQMN
jgi:hypothetical protein